MDSFHSWFVNWFVGKHTQTSHASDVCCNLTVETRSDWCFNRVTSRHPRNHTPSMRSGYHIVHHTRRRTLLQQREGRRNGCKTSAGLWSLRFEVFFFVVKKCLFNLDLRILGGWKSDPNIFSQVRFCSKWWFSSHGRIESIKFITNEKDPSWKQVSL